MPTYYVAQKTNGGKPKWRIVFVTPSEPAAWTVYRAIQHVLARAIIRHDADGTQTMLDADGSHTDMPTWRPGRNDTERA
jgi:hypothetical protein